MLLLTELHPQTWKKSFSKVTLLHSEICAFRVASCVLAEPSVDRALSLKPSTTENKKKLVENLPASSPTSKDEFRKTERMIQKRQETCEDLQILHINTFSNSFIQSSLSALLNIANSCQIYSDK